MGTSCEDGFFWFCFLRLLIGSTDAFTVNEVNLPTVLFFPSRGTCTMWQGTRGALGSRQRYGDQARCRGACIKFSPKDPITLRGLTVVLFSIRQLTQTFLISQRSLVIKRHAQKDSW